MGKKNRKNKVEQRQISQPPTDTSEATQEQEIMNDADLLSDVGPSVIAPNVATMIGPRALPCIGWGATPAQHMLKMNYDTNLARLCKAVGLDGYHFMAYPLGGIERAGFSFPEDLSVPVTGVPPMKLPDVQFDRYLWETYIIGSVSPWIDTDNPEESRSRASIQALRSELKHAAYLGLRTVIIPVLRANPVNLMRAVHHFLWVECVDFNIVLLLPTKQTLLLDHEKLINDSDIFNFWVSIRRNLKNYHSDKLCVGLKLANDMDEEFCDRAMYERWKGEALNLFVLTDDSFNFYPSPPILNSNLKEMDASHKTLITDLCTAPDAQKFLVAPNCQIWPVQRKQIAEFLSPMLNEACRIRQLPAEDNWDLTLHDRLALPMETIWRDLSSGEYDSLESDKYKYKTYGEAMTKAFQAVCKDPVVFNTGIVIYILGAGRGGLITTCLEVIKSRLHGTLHNIVTLIAIEKNPHAVMSMTYKNESLWHRKVKIIEGDMRFILQDPNLPKADIIISELLGSFGDNELAPECWKSCIPILKDDTECIPFQFGSFAAPVCAPKIRDQLRDSFVSVFDSERAIHARFDSTTGRYKYGRPQNWYDHIFVCPMKRYYEVASPKHVTQFKFPKLDDEKEMNNERDNVIEYTIKHSCEINGFAGYFAAVLANEVFLSNSSRFRTNLDRNALSKSWFPSYIPLRDGIHVQGGTMLAFLYWRKVCDTGAWYEWRVEYTDYGTGERVVTDLQNEGGHSYFMPLPPNPEEIKDYF